MFLKEILKVISATVPITIIDGRRVELFTGRHTDIKDKLLLTYRVEKIESIENRLTITIKENWNKFLAFLVKKIGYFLFKKFQKTYWQLLKNVV